MRKNIFILSILLVVFVFIGISCNGPDAAEEVKKTPAEESAVPEEAVNNTELARKFVTLLLDGKFESAEKKFDDKMREALPSNKLEEAWNMTVCEAGPFREQLGTRTEQIDIYDIVFVTCEFEETLIDIKIVFNKKKEISGLFFLPGLSQDLEKELTIVSEKFIKLLDDGKFQEGAGNFDKTMTEELTPEMLEEAWKALIAQLGTFKGTINSRAEKEGKYNIIFITCELEKGAVDIKLVFNNKQQISGLFFFLFSLFHTSLQII